jgi:hypothetical protein
MDAPGARLIPRAFLILGTQVPQPHPRTPRRSTFDARAFLTSWSDLVQAGQSKPASSTMSERYDARPRPTRARSSSRQRPPTPRRRPECRIDPRLPRRNRLQEPILPASSAASLRLSGSTFETRLVPARSPKTGLKGLPRLASEYPLTPQAKHRLRLRKVQATPPRGPARHRSGELVC